MEGNGMEMDSGLVWMGNGRLKKGEKSVNVEGEHILVVTCAGFGKRYSRV